MAFSSDAERRRYWAKKKAAEKGGKKKAAPSGQTYAPRKPPVDPHAHSYLEWPEAPQSDGDKVRCPGCGQVWIWDSEKGWIPVPAR